MELLTMATNPAAQKFVGEMFEILTLVMIATGGGLGIWGIVGILDAQAVGDTAGQNKGIKQLVGGIGIALVGVVGVEALNELIGEMFN